MRYETFSSNVKRINQRIVQTAKSFGKDSPLYKEYEAKIEKMIPSDFININKRGEIQISRSKKLFEYGGQTYVEKISKTRTVADIRKQARISLQEEIPKNRITQQMISKRVKERFKIDEKLNESLALLYGRDDEIAQKAIETMREKGQKTYSDLIDTINAAENSNITQINIKNLFEGL